MKVLVKYLWTLIIVPVLLFVKGDLSLDTFIEVNRIEPLMQAKARVESNLNPKPQIPLILPVKTVSEKNDFSGDGMLVTLYDRDYNVLDRAQIIQGKVTFQLTPKQASVQDYVAVVKETADELVFAASAVPNSVLTIYEEHLNDGKQPSQLLIPE